jgi:hypothetical protein
LVAVFYVTQVFNKGEKGKVAFMAWMIWFGQFFYLRKFFCLTRTGV